MSSLSTRLLVLCDRPSLCLSACFWVWRCGNGSAVTGFLRSGASGAQRLVRWSKPRRAPPLAEAALGPHFQYREAESPRCGKEGRDAGEAGEGLGHASACGAQQGRGRRQLFCPPTHPACTIPHRLPLVKGTVLNCARISGSMSEARPGCRHWTCQTNGLQLPSSESSPPLLVVSGPRPRPSWLLSPPPCLCCWSVASRRCFDALRCADRYSSTCLCVIEVPHLLPEATRTGF